MSSENNQDVPIDNEVAIVERDEVGARNAPPSESPRPRSGPLQALAVFLQLPSEQQALVHQAPVLSTDDSAVPVRTLDLGSDGDELKILTRDPGTADEAWNASAAAWSEAQRTKLVLPVLLLTFEGANVYDVHAGTYRLHLPEAVNLGLRPTPRDTVCFLPRNAAYRMFWQPDYLHLCTYVGIRTLLLDPETFLAVLAGLPAPFHFARGWGQPGAAFAGVLPDLRRILVGFTDRWPDVTLVEGARSEDILSPVEVVDNAAEDRDGDGDAQHGDNTQLTRRWRVASPVPVEPTLAATIITTVLLTRADVERMRGDGVQVDWVLVQSRGILRLREVIEGFEGLLGDELDEQN